MDPITAANTVAGAITFAQQAKGQLKTVAAAMPVFNGNSSLIDIAKIARVEPICLIDADVANLEYVSDVTQSLQSIFAGYYLQAVALTNNLSGISVARRLGPLNPNRPLALEGLSPDKTIVSHAYKYKLPMSQNETNIALEASTNVSFNENATKSTMEMSNLSVGKLYDVTITEGDKSAVLKVAIRLMANSIPTSLLSQLLSFKKSHDMDLKERYHSWRAGRLSFFKDLILCNDLIDKHRNMSIKDSSGIYQQILDRENNNIKAGVLNSSPSMATASNMVITSTDTIDQIENLTGSKIKNFKARQAIFETTNLMILAVIDKEWERVTWYYRGIAEFSTTSIKDIKASNKGSNGSEVLDMMKSFMSGSSASI